MTKAVAAASMTWLFALGATAQEPPSESDASEQERLGVDEAIVPELADGRDAPREAGGDQSRESMSVDSTAAQWSLQFAYQGIPRYYGSRPPGVRRFFQFRFVAPIPAGKISILPRLTIRVSEAADGTWGLSPTDIFALIVPVDWGTGRFGIGPDIVTPATTSKLGPSGARQWQYGLASALIQRLANDRVLIGLLLQQVFGQIDASRPNTVFANDLIINPFLAVQLGKGVYLQNGDMQARYDWRNKAFWTPLPIRVGYVLIKPKYTLNFYGEYQTSVFSRGWVKPALKHAYRLNISLQIPVGL
ncbi:MAG: hypothetical protein HKN37_03940 [Rhodothermales bacterium]|nr:hypothetical protein [Acidimicrobiia bacterium]NNE45791.1 hypothetical protein [Rhodothermales bacterium]